jgi:predicted transcriptional regulator
LDDAEPRGLTRYELAERTNRPVSSVCGRINELEKLGLVNEADESRPTPYGGNAVVMRIADAHRTVKQMTMF